jgi:hypothetical protein
MPGRRVAAYVGKKIDDRRTREPPEPILGTGKVAGSLVSNLERRRPNILPKAADAFRTWSPGERIFNRK